MLKSCAWDFVNETNGWKGQSLLILQSFAIVGPDMSTLLVVCSEVKVLNNENTQK